MRLTIAFSKIQKRNLVLINNATYQRETLSERPIRQPLTLCRKEAKRLLLHEACVRNDAFCFLLPLFCLRCNNNFLLVKRFSWPLSWQKRKRRNKNIVTLEIRLILVSGLWCTLPDSSWPATWVSYHAVPLWLLQVAVPSRRGYYEGTL